MQRVLSTVTLLGLLVATAAAFAITEHLKLIKSPVYGPRATRYFSPVCGCATAKAVIGSKLRHSDSITVTILDLAGHTVATLASDVSEPRGPTRFTWDGRTDAGTQAPDGAYRPEIALPHRTILLPDRIRLVTTVPKVLSVNVGSGVFSPDGDHFADTIAIRYTLSEHAHALVYLNGVRIIRGRSSLAQDVVKWGGGFEGSTEPAGRYVLSIGAVDQAGNTTPASERKQVVVVIRFIELTQKRIRVRSGARFSVRVDTDARRWTWHFGSRNGDGHGKVLRLRAPTRPGTYPLSVAEHGHTASGTVVVG